MGWRPSRIRDVIVVALVRHGPLTISQLAETINERHFEDWQIAHGHWPQKHYGSRENKKGEKSWGTINEPEPVGYTDLYSRLRTMQGGVVVQDGITPRSDATSRSGAYLWRAITREDLAQREAERRAKLTVDPALRERVESAARAIGCEVEFRVEEHGGDSHGWIVLTTKRGSIDTRDSEASGPPYTTWQEAAEGLGL